MASLTKTSEEKDGIDGACHRCTGDGRFFSWSKNFGQSDDMLLYAKKQIYVETEFHYLTKNILAAVSEGNKVHTSGHIQRFVISSFYFQASSQMGNRERKTDQLVPSDTTGDLK